MSYRKALLIRCLLVVLLCLPAGLAPAAAKGWKAGAAAVRITPEGPVWLAGYGRRDRPSQGVAQHLYAKALAIEDAHGQRSVLVAVDMLGFTRDLAQRVARRARDDYQLPRDALLLNSSHTHAGPVIGRMFATGYLNMRQRDWDAVDDYTRVLEDKIVQVIGKAIANLSPANLDFGRTRAGFAVNRRIKTPTGYRGAFHNWEGPVDHDVPVLRVTGPGGKIRGIVFGYACHNTAIRPDVMKFHGGWSGTAQHELETRYPGAVALFLAGCGGDINPYPFGSQELAEIHGRALAGMVRIALGRPLRPLSGPLRVRYEEFPIRFQKPKSREEFERISRQDHPYRRIHAKKMLAILDRDGELPKTYPYPLQVWSFGPELTLIAMGGEVVVDYVLRLNRELDAEKIWVAGFSNDVLGYIPSARILAEGGAEAETETIYYDLPAPFAPSIEETIVAKVHQWIAQTQ